MLRLNPTARPLVILAAVAMLTASLAGCDPAPAQPSENTADSAVSSKSPISTAPKAATTPTAIPQKSGVRAPSAQDAKGDPQNKRRY